MNTDIVAIIPARGGSERLPGKNLLPLCGKSLIRWTLEAAKNSDVIDLMVVTSDDAEILQEAKDFGASAIKRPVELATSTASSFDAILHALYILEKDGVKPHRLMLLQPTSPLRTAEDIINAVVRMDETGANSVISVCKTEHSPLWCNTLDEGGRMDGFISDTIRNQRSQDLATYYCLNGAVYLALVDDFIEQKGFFMKDSRAIVMPRERSVDIDCEMDFEMARFLMGKRIEQQVNGS